MQRDRGLGGLADDVAEVAEGQPGAKAAAPRVDEQERPQFLRRGPERVQLRVGQVAAGHAGGDLGAAHAELGVGHPQLVGGELGVLQRHRGQAHQAVRLLRDRRGDVLVGRSDDVVGQRRVGPVVVEGGDDADRVDVDAGGVHLGQPGAEVVEQRAVARRHQLGVPLDRLGAERRELRGLLGGQPRLVRHQPEDGRHVDMRVDVDHGGGLGSGPVRDVHGRAGPGDAPRNPPAGPGGTPPRTPRAGPGGPPRPAKRLRRSRAHAPVALDAQARDRDSAYDVPAGIRTHSFVDHSAVDRGNDPREGPGQRGTASGTVTPRRGGFRCSRRAETCSFRQAAECCDMSAMRQLESFSAGATTARPAPQHTVAHRLRAA